MERGVKEGAESRPTEKHGAEALCALLQAVRRLEAFSAAQELQGDAARSTARSTRALIRLMEGWCIDHAVRARHAALDGLTPDASDDTVLAALYQHFAL